VPLIVLVHGGPLRRGASWEWYPRRNSWHARLRRGCRPEFRGGNRLRLRALHAGWHTVGPGDAGRSGRRSALGQSPRAMPDPARIAIGGASYGGYATLMGLIEEPELFRCGFEVRRRDRHRVDVLDHLERCPPTKREVRYPT